MPHTQPLARNQTAQQGESSWGLSWPESGPAIPTLAAREYDEGGPEPGWGSAWGRRRVSEQGLGVWHMSDSG